MRVGRGGTEIFDSCGGTGTHQPEEVMGPDPLCEMLTLSNWVVQRWKRVLGEEPRRLGWDPRERCGGRGSHLPTGWKCFLF